MMNGKMMKTAGTFETMFRVMGSVLCAMVFVCVIFTVLVLLLGEKMFAPDFVTLDIGFIKFYLTDEYRSFTDSVKLYAVVGLLSMAVLFAVGSYICVLLRRILLPMKEGRPFEETTARNLRKVAWAILGGGLFMQILRVAEEFLLIRAYPMEEIFASDAITSMEHMITVDFNFVIVAAAFILLSYIFSYGQALQRESDETL